MSAPTPTPRIAVIDDEPRMTRILTMILAREGYDVTGFEDPKAFCAAFENERPFDLVMTDLKMPGLSGLEVLEWVHARHEDIPVILLAAHGSIATAIEAMKRGAYDFVEKPFDNDACKALVARALKAGAMSRENRYLRAQMAERYKLDDLIVASDAMRQTVDLAHRA